MSTYCVNCENHGAVWRLKAFAEDRYKEVGNKSFNSWDALVEVLEACSIPSDTIHQIEATARDGGKAAFVIEIPENDDRLANLLGIQDWRQTKTVIATPI